MKRNKMISFVKVYACLSDCLLMNIEGQNIEKIKLQCTDTHKNGFIAQISQNKGFYTNIKSLFTNWGDIRADLPDIRGTTI